LSQTFRRVEVSSRYRFQGLSGTCSLQTRSPGRSALNHPNICTIHDIGEEKGTAFIAMEYLDGVALDQLIHGQPLDLDRILELSCEIAAALASAHSKNIIHRDIKPANIFVITQRGQAKALDFGLAKMADTSEELNNLATLTLTQAGMAIGTLPICLLNNCRVVLSLTFGSVAP